MDGRFRRGARTVFGRCERIERRGSGRDRFYIAASEMRADAAALAY